VEFDPENLQRVLANLLDNALRHSSMATGKETAKIVVSLDFTAHQCLIDVIDTGNGVPPADQAKLFEPIFYDSRGRQWHGAVSVQGAVRNQ
jgi:two-component system sensor histidine kinase PilS (NtrC family)